MKPLTRVTTIASACICLLLLAVFVASYHTENWRHSIDITSSVTLGAADGWVALSRSEGQYIAKHLHGSLLAYEGGEAIGKRDWKFGIPACGAGQRTYTSDQGEFVAKDIGVVLPGGYYRWFQRKNQPLLWTFMFSLWYPVILSAVLPLLLLSYRRHGPSTNKGVAGDSAASPKSADGHAQPAAPDHGRSATHVR